MAQPIPWPRPSGAQAGTLLSYRLVGFAFALLLAIFWSAQLSLAASSSPTAPPLHIVKAGETLWAISRMHRLTPEAIARANGLSSPDRLQIGQQLAHPTPPSATPPRAAGAVSAAPDIHVVQAGETLWSIARRHGRSVDALAALNGLADANRLRPGQKLLLSQTAGSPRAALRRPGLAWPSRGVITSRFEFRGTRHHHGIDIAAPVGTPITAALDGTVQFAGWLGGYGRLVILDHGDGLTTYYGHASRLLVKVGDRVKRGQLVARVGTTGNVTGPNLHFEMRRNKVPLDPLAFLQGQPSQRSP